MQKQLATPFGAAARGGALVLLLTCAVLSSSGCGSLQIRGRSILNPVWTTEGDTPLRANSVDVSLDPPLKRVWVFNAGAGFGRVSPLITGDVALISTRRGEVHAVDLMSGRRVGQAAFGESIDGTPVIANGILYLPVSWGRHVLYAYDLRTGTTSWRVEGAPIEAGLVVFEDLVIAADLEGMVRAFGRADGSVRWESRLGEKVAVRGAPVLVEDRLIVGADDGRVTAIDAVDGSVLWQVNTGSPIFAPLSASSDQVYVASTRGNLSALDVSTGELAWTYTLPGEKVYVTAPAVGNEDIVFGASDGFVRSLEPSDGSLLWAAQVDGAVAATPLISAQTIYVGTMRSRLIGLARQDGARVWETEVEGRIKSPFAVSGTQLLVLTEPRHVYLFDVEEASYADRRQ